MTEEILHARYSPSQADRFFLCPGSCNLIERSPSRASDEHADEGTKAHALLEATLAGGFNNPGDAIKALGLGHHDFNMYTAVRDATDYIHNLYSELNMLFGDAQMYVETYVNPPINSAPGEAAGKCDVAVVSKNGRQLYVIDYKHGVGVPKDAIDNRQATQYAAGLLFGGHGIVNPEDIDSVVLVIIQPRAFHKDGDVREYAVDVEYVRQYLHDLDNKIAECQKPDAPLIPGYDQCRFCPVKYKCPALENSAMSVINQDFSTIHDVKESGVPSPKSFSLDKLSYALQAMDLLKLWIKDTEAYAKELAMSGTNPPGYKLVHSSTRRQWYGDADKLAPRLAALIGCPPDDLYSKKFVTITEAEALVKNAFKKKVSKRNRKKAAEQAKKSFAYFTTKEASNNLSLVPEADQRAAVNVTEKTFGNIGRNIQPPSPKGE